MSSLGGNLVGCIFLSPQIRKLNFSKSEISPTGVPRPLPANFHIPTAISRSGFAYLLYVPDASFFEQPFNLAMPSMYEILPSGVRRHPAKSSSSQLLFTLGVTEVELIIPKYASDNRICINFDNLHILPHVATYYHISP